MPPNSALIGDRRLPRKEPLSWGIGPLIVPARAAFLLFRIEVISASF
jgi:hypothetical protein